MNGNFTLCSGINRAEAVESLVKAGAGELYCGVNINENMNSVGTMGITRRGSLPHNVRDMAELAELIDEASRFGVPVNLLMNVAYRDEQFPLLMSVLEKAVAAGISNLVVKDIGLALQVRKNFPKLGLHASSTLGVGTGDAAKLLKDMDFKRIILPREIEFSSAKKMASTKIELELLFYRERCFFDDSHCYFHHNVTLPDMGHFSYLRSKPLTELRNALPMFMFAHLQNGFLRFQPSPAGCMQHYKPADTDRKARVAKKFLKRLRSHEQNWACGACILPEAYASKIRYLKIVNRSLDPVFQMKSVAFAKSVVEAYQKAADRQDFQSACKSLYRRAHAVMNCETKCSFPV